MACEPDGDACGVQENLEAALLQQGWTRCFAAEGARLEEAIATYREIGFEVTTLAVIPFQPACTACIPADGSLRMIYTRPAKRTEDP